MKKIDMCEDLNKEVFKVSYSSVVNTINKIDRNKKEAYIREEYIPGDVVEFDFGTVKLYTENNLVREYELTVFTSAYSNFRWARLFPKQNTSYFLESHTNFFKEIKGTFRIVLYHNTRVAAGNFIGISDKKPTIY